MMFGDETRGNAPWHIMFNPMCHCMFCFEYLHSFVFPHFYSSITLWFAVQDTYLNFLSQFLFSLTLIPRKLRDSLSYSLFFPFVELSFLVLLPCMKCATWFIWLYISMLVIFICIVEVSCAVIMRKKSLGHTSVATPEGLVHLVLLHASAWTYDGRRCGVVAVHVPCLQNDRVLGQQPRSIWLSVWIIAKHFEHVIHKKMISLLFFF